jgi:hypothetical protein
VSAPRRLADERYVETRLVKLTAADPFRGKEAGERVQVDHPAIFPVLRRLVSLTQVIDGTRTDNGSSMGEQRNMNVDAQLEANAQFAEAGKQGVRSLAPPAMPAHPFIVRLLKPSISRWRYILSTSSDQ